MSGYNQYTKPKLPPTHHKTEAHKVGNIKYNKFELASYLNSPLFNNENRILLLALRTRTVRGIRNDFRGMYADNMCPLGTCSDSSSEFSERGMQARLQTEF